MKKLSFLAKMASAQSLAWAAQGATAGAAPRRPSLRAANAAGARPWGGRSEAQQQPQQQQAKLRARGGQRGLRLRVAAALVSSAAPFTLCSWPVRCLGGGKGARRACGSALPTAE